MIASHEDRPRKTVLIVDDDEMITGALHQRLGEAGHSIDVVTDPAKARVLLDQHCYGVVLMDIYMTGQLHGRGSDLLDEVRRLRRRAHLVILTAYGVDELTDRFRGEVDVTVVRKPMPVNVLAALVESILPIESGSGMKRSQP